MASHNQIINHWYQFLISTNSVNLPEARICLDLKEVSSFEEHGRNTTNVHMKSGIIYTLLFPYNEFVLSVERKVLDMANLPKYWHEFIGTNSEEGPAGKIALDLREIQSFEEHGETCVVVFPKYGTWTKLLIKYKEFAEIMCIELGD